MFLFSRLHWVTGFFKWRYSWWRETSLPNLLGRPSLYKFSECFQPFAQNKKLPWNSKTSPPLWIIKTKEWKKIVDIRWKKWFLCNGFSEKTSRGIFPCQKPTPRVEIWNFHPENLGGRCSPNLTFAYFFKWIGEKPPNLLWIFCFQSDFVTF